jgi:diadenosine tetraphosphate (Ap4A) HIT family hydrolase
MSCIFCRIVNNELASSRVYEDEHTVAFLDIHPIAQGHTLVVPRRHVESYTNLSSEEVAQLAQAGRLVAAHLKSAVAGCEGVSLSLADGTSAGQEVPHAHLHVIPRRHGDGFGWKFPPEYNAEAVPRDQLDPVAALLRASINSERAS